MKYDDYGKMDAYGHILLGLAELQLTGEKATMLISPLDIEATEEQMLSILDTVPYFKRGTTQDEPIEVGNFTVGSVYTVDDALIHLETIFPSLDDLNAVYHCLSRESDEEDTVELHHCYQYGHVFLNKRKFAALRGLPLESLATVSFTVFLYQVPTMKSWPPWNWVLVAIRGSKPEVITTGAGDENPLAALIPLLKRHQGNPHMTGTSTFNIRDIKDGWHLQAQGQRFWFEMLVRLNQGCEYVITTTDDGIAIPY